MPPVPSREPSSSLGLWFPKSSLHWWLLSVSKGNVLKMLVPYFLVVLGSMVGMQKASMTLPEVETWSIHYQWLKVLLVWIKVLSRPLSPETDECNLKQEKVLQFSVKCKYRIMCVVLLAVFFLIFLPQLDHKTTYGYKLDIFYSSFLKLCHCCCCC